MVDFYFNSKTGRYHNRANNVFVKRTEVLKHLDLEHARMKVRMQGHARLVSSGKITVSDFQTRMAEDIKRSHLRLGLLGSGGEKSASQRQYGAIGQRLREEYNFLKGFGKAIATGEMSQERIIWRAGLYANSSASAFYKAEQISRVENGATEAKRWLDSTVAIHCNSCPGHSTNGKWLPVEQVTIPSRDCICRSRCRCGIKYRKSNTRSLNTVSESFAIAVNA